MGKGWADCLNEAYTARIAELRNKIEEQKKQGNHGAD
jgi:hypothetical protein